MGFLPALFSAAVFLTSISGVYGIVVGIDFGNALTKVAVAVPGRPLDLVLNEESKRKTPTAVSFAGEIREFGDSALSRDEPDAATKEVALPFEVFPFEYSILTPHEHTKTESPVTYIVKRKPEIIQATSMDIASHFFQYIADMVRKTFKAVDTPIDAVITIPSDATMLQRKAISSAAELAGINVLGLITDVSAAGMHHLRDLPAEFNGTKLFIDVGAATTQACLINFTAAGKKRSGALIGCRNSRKVGGTHFDVALYNHVKQIARKALKEDLTQRSEQRLFQEVQKAKLVLSANKQASINIPSFQNTLDFHTVIDRARFEDLIELSVERIPLVVSEVLTACNTSLGSIDAVELIGAGWRVPFVHSTLEKAVAPKAVGQHLNGDEAIALGAALMAANSSLSFQIKDLKFVDAATYSYIVRLRNITETSTESNDWVSRELVSRGSRWGGYRTLKNRGCHDFDVQLYETDDVGSSTLLREWTVTGILEACTKNYTHLEPPKTAIVFSTPSTGLISLERATAQWDEVVQVPVLPPKAKNATWHNDLPKNSSAEKGDIKSEAHSETARTSENATISPTPNATISPTPDIAADTNATNGSDLDADKAPTVTKEEIKKHAVHCRIIPSSKDVKVTESRKSQLTNAKTQLNSFVQADADFTRLATAKNSLEEFLYSSRSSLTTDRIAEVTTEKSRTDLRAVFDAVEEWIYADGLTAKLGAVEKKLSELKQLFEPVLFRAAEIERRNALYKDIEFFEGLLRDKLRSEELELRGINATRAEKIMSDYKKWIEEFRATRKTQESKPLYEDPAFHTETIRPKLASFARRLKMLLSSAQPQKITTTTAPKTNATNETTAEGATEPSNPETQNTKLDGRDEL